MTTVNDVPQLVDIKGGSYAAIAPKLEPGKFNNLPEKWLTFSQGLRNANHTQTLDLANIYERSSEEYLRDLDIEYQEKALLANSKRFIKRRNNFSVNNYYQVSKGFQPKFTPKLIQSSPNSSSQADPKVQKDYKAEYKKMKAKVALLEAKVSDDEEVTQVKIQNTELTKLNHALQEQLKEEKKINKKWLTSSKKVSQCISEQIPHQKKKFLKVKRLNPDSKLPNFNTERILVPESQAVNESLKPTKTSITPKSFKDSEAESLIPLPPLKNLQGASPSSEDSLNKSVSGTITVRETKATTPLVPTEVKDTEQELKINELTKVV
ncbi:hypothetical protein Tco_0671684 [Tanacetum coccineum]